MRFRAGDSMAQISLGLLLAWLPLTQQACTLDGLVVTAAACPAGAWRTVQHASFGTEDEDGGTWGALDGGWAGHVLCGGLGPVMGATAALGTSFELEALPHETAMLAMDLVVANWSGVSVTVALDNTTIWSSGAAEYERAAAWETRPTRVGAAITCSARLADRSTSIVVSVPHSSATAAVTISFSGGGAGALFGVDNVRLALPERAPLGEVGTTYGIGTNRTTTVYLRGHYTRPVIFTSVASAPASARLTWVQVHHHRPQNDAVTVDCPALGFVRCGDACIPRSSCWRDVAVACAAVDMEICAAGGAAQCVPKGSRSCGGRWSFDLQVAGEECVAGAEHATAPVSWLAVESGQVRFCPQLAHRVPCV